ncbi:MAG: hypothetical protein NTY19_30715 [Planctomycetota bacterium]|nr:hypothetical protein [Planctomycetota bacterium]
MCEAVEIAKAHGVVVPEYAAFFVDELGWLDEHTTARGPKVTKAPGGIVVWEDLLNKFGQVPFIIRREILESDEAVVAVMAHEMHELNGLLPLLRRGQLTIEHFEGYTSPTNPGNLHSEAWDVADKLVEKMRRKYNDS